MLWCSAFIIEAYRKVSQPIPILCTLLHSKSILFFQFVFFFKSPKLFNKANSVRFDLTAEWMGMCLNELESISRIPNLSRMNYSRWSSTSASGAVVWLFWCSVHTWNHSPFHVMTLTRGWRINDKSDWVGCYVWPAGWLAQQNRSHFEVILRLWINNFSSSMFVSIFERECLRFVCKLIRWRNKRFALIHCGQSDTRPNFHRNAYYIDEEIL